jgi:tetratricopeptide (TPR) repeat protein
MNSKKNRPEQKTVPERNEDREFLLSRLGSNRLTGHSSEAEISDLSDPLPAGSQVSDDHAFMHQVKELTAEIERFGLLVVKADPAPEGDEHPESEDRARHTEDRARIVGEICSREAGMWGEIEGGMFGCCLPGSDTEASLVVSREIQQNINHLGNGSVSIGSAIYPMLDYDQGQTVENARKALAHASFFGPGSLVAFDAVSLNISGDAMYQAGDVTGAAKEFERGLEIDPREENLHNSLGVCFGIQGDHKKALEAFEKTLGINPDNVMALHNAGYSKSILGDTQGALDFLLRADKLGGDLFEVAFHTGKLLVEVGRPEEGKPFLERAVQLNPDSSMGHFFMGECCRELGQSDQAISAYRLAIKRNPNDAGALSALGMLYDEKGENSEISMLFCEKSVELAPENGLHLYRLGSLLHNHGEAHKALDMFEKAQAFGYDAAEKIAAVETELEKFACLDAHNQA